MKENQLTNIIGQTNKGFYPTPEALISRMVAKIKGNPGTILEPSAGKGDILEYFEKYRYGHRQYSSSDLSAIELDEDLQAVLRGKGYKVLDGDFLTFAGPDKFDLIIANPPFDAGDMHLLKAIDIMYRGEIVFLLNAETIKNPCTNSRKELAKKLKVLKAEIEYIPDAFLEAERKTAVEVALIYINIARKVEDDLFSGATDQAEPINPEIEEDFEVSTKKTVDELVAEYNQTVRIGMETILDYYRNYPKIGGYLCLNREPEKYYRSREDMTTQMQHQINALLKAVRTTFWRRTLDIPEVHKRMTSKRQNEFEDQLKQRCNMDFTEHNILQFILNLIGSYEDTLTAAVLEIFDQFTIRHCWSNGLYDENIHYFNGWKTNKAFKVGRKVIIPIYAGYDGGPFFCDWSNKWKLDYGAQNILRDIDTVMNYFDGLSNYITINHAIEMAFNRGQSSKIESTYFTITCYKKGTIHLTFNDDGILRRFNVAACRGKNWLPHDYGKKSYRDMEPEEQNVTESFEGSVSYEKNRHIPLFASHCRLSIAA